MTSLDALATEADVIALVQGVRLARLIGASPQLDRFRGEEDRRQRAALSTQAELQALVRRSARPTGATGRHLRDGPGQRTPTPSSTPRWPCTAWTGCAWPAPR